MYKSQKYHQIAFNDFNQSCGMQLDMSNQWGRLALSIVSLSQPYIRPIVRGKAKSPVEFGAKYDVSIDEKGHARLEKLTFDPYNESTVFQDAIERYRKRTGHYPVRTLVDRYTERGRTAPIARNTASVCQA